jgi:two-component system sensor kinase FixL
LLLADGSECWISFSARPLLYEKEKAFIVGLIDRTQRKQLEDQIRTVSDRERNRIGQDLHDDICQRMAGISILSAALEKTLRASSSNQADMAGQISAFINETIDQTRKLAAGLYPVSLQQMGLDQSLEELLDYFRNKYSIECRFENRSGEIPNFSDQQKMHLYRITQEALSNAARHSKGSLLELILERNNGFFSISVRDNGKGMKNKQTTGGMGMAILRNRADTLGAEIIYSSREQGGTCMLCRIEVKES